MSQSNSATKSNRRPIPASWRGTKTAWTISLTACRVRLCEFLRFAGHDAREEEPEKGGQPHGVGQGSAGESDAAQQGQDGAAMIRQRLPGVA